MNDEACVVEVNGTNYYAPCNSIEYISVVNGHLINTSSTNITLYYEFPDPNVNGSGYPRITLNSNTMGMIRTAYGGNAQTLSVSSYEVVNRHTSNDVLLLIVLIGVSVLNLFKR